MVDKEDLSIEELERQKKEIEEELERRKKELLEEQNLNEEL